MKKTLDFDPEEARKIVDNVTDKIEYCDTCGEALSCPDNFLGGLVTVLCKCKREKIEAEAQKKKLDKLRSECFDFIKQHGQTFEADAGYNPALTKIAKNYVENFDKLSRKGQGLLLYGSYGCGKTFASHQIANALIDKGHRVRVSTFESLYALYRENGFSGKFFNHLANFDLVVLDDLGAEYQTNQIRSFIFEIINTLYEARTPFIITTNLQPAALKDPADAESARVYDRIFERCPRPVDASAPNIRYKIVRDTHKEYDNTLGIS